MTVGVYDNRYTCWNGCSTNPCNVCIRLRSGRPDADGAGLASNTLVADVDIVIAASEVLTGLVTKADVIAAGRIVIQRISAYRSV
jgi:hypothetical protein